MRLRLSMKTCQSLPPSSQSDDHMASLTVLWPLVQQAPIQPQAAYRGAAGAWYCLCCSRVTAATCFPDSNKHEQCDRPSCWQPSQRLLHAVPPFTASTRQRSLCTSRA